MSLTQPRYKLLAGDKFKPMVLRQLCANDDAAPFDLPLHPGTKRFDRERGYLK